MKFVTKEELEGHAQATRRGAVEGIAASLVVGIPASYVLHRRWAYYRSLPVTIKVLGVILIAGPAFAIQAERRGVEYDQSTWTGAGKLELERERSEEDKRWQSLSRWEKMSDWGYRNQWPIVFGCWTASMAVSWMILARNRTQTFSQKIVQARVYAQGATLATALGAAMLTHTQRSKMLEQKGVDHSWVKMLEQQEIESHSHAHAAVH